MAELFSSAPLLFYLVTVLLFLSSTRLYLNQRMILLYSIVYLLFALDKVDVSIALAYVLLISFLIEEYLHPDTVKLAIIRKFPYKLIDWLYMLFFRYSILTYTISMLLLYFAKHPHELTNYFPTLENSSFLVFVLHSMAFLCLFRSIHRTMSPKLGIKSFSASMELINEYSLSQYRRTGAINEDQQNILLTLEDRTFFTRGLKFTIFNWKYFKIRFLGTQLDMVPLLRRKGLIFTLHAIKRKLSEIKKLDWKSILKNIVIWRGRSTIEMQLLRTIFLSYGYANVRQRKIFEIVYAKIFFNGFYHYLGFDVHKRIREYKEYLLNLYIHQVNVRIQSKEIKFSDAFGYDYPYEDVTAWNNTKFMIATLGLSHKTLDEGTFDKYKSLYPSLFEKCKIDRESVAEYLDLLKDYDPDAPKG